MNFKKLLLYLVLLFAAIFLLFFLSNTQHWLSDRLECPNNYACNDPDKICIKPTTGICSKNLFCEPSDENCICV